MEERMERVMVNHYDKLHRLIKSVENGEKKKGLRLKLFQMTRN